MQSAQIAEGLPHIPVKCTYYVVLKTVIEVRMLGRRRSRLRKWSPTWVAETILSLYAANDTFTKALYLFGVSLDGFGKKSKMIKRWG